LWSSETSDHLQEDLAKFGYKPVMKVENLNKPFIFSLLNLVILVIYLFRNMASESQFFHKNPLHVSKSYSSGPEKRKKCSSQKINTLYVIGNASFQRWALCVSATLLKGHFIERCYLALLESFRLYCGLIFKYKSLGGAFSIQFHTQYFLFWYAKVLTCLEHNSFSQSNNNFIHDLIYERLQVASSQLNPIVNTSW
jgi:hypothetical protein